MCTLTKYLRIVVFFFYSWFRISRITEQSALADPRDVGKHVLVTGLSDGQDRLQLIRIGLSIRSTDPLNRYDLLLDYLTKANWE